jgi:P27 family predicted phage terminase small subunit
MRGRKPKPTSIKLVTGNPGHRPPPTDEPKPAARIPKCPSHLDAEAKREWRRMARELDDLGILTSIDKAIFAVYCESWSLSKQIEKSLQKEGMIIRAKTREIEHPDGTIVRTGGVPMVNPRYKLKMMAVEKMMKALIEMGMSPSSRGRVTVARKKSDDQAQLRIERFF